MIEVSVLLSNYIVYICTAHLIRVFSNWYFCVVENVIMAVFTSREALILKLSIMLPYPTIKLVTLFMYISDASSVSQSVIAMQCTYYTFACIWLIFPKCQTFFVETKSFIWMCIARIVINGLFFFPKRYTFCIWILGSMINFFLQLGTSWS